MFNIFKKKDLVADYILVKNIVKILGKNNIKTMKKLGKLNYFSLIKIKGFSDTSAELIISYFYFYKKFKDENLFYSKYYSFCYHKIAKTNYYGYRCYPQYLYFEARLKKRANRS
jgi:hypothetical protein